MLKRKEKRQNFLKENGLKFKEKYYIVDLKSGYHIISGKNRKDLVLKYYDVETQRKLNKVRQKEYYLKLVDDLNNFKENTKFEKKERWLHEDERINLFAFIES